jgi:hypothetical protein
MRHVWERASFGEKVRFVLGMTAIGLMMLWLTGAPAGLEPWTGILHYD